MSVQTISAGNTTLLSDQSTYGVWNHFSLKKTHRQTAERYGLNVQKQNDGSYRVRSRDGYKALELVSGHSADASGAVSLNRSELKDLIGFLHQPIRFSLSPAHRTLGHNISRFITTGLVEIPEYVDEDLAGAASLECHEKGERKMKETDVWNNASEFWASDISDSDVSTIPGTSYDPHKGFVFHLNDGFLNPETYGGPAQKQLAATLKKLVVGNSSQDFEGFVEDREGGAALCFSHQTLRDFYERVAATPGLEELCAKAQIEEKTQAMLAKIRQDAETLRQDNRFHVALADRQTNIDPRQKIENLAHVATALTPLIASSSMYEVRRHSYYIESALDLSNPQEEIAEEYAVLSGVLEHLKQQADEGYDLDAADLQAISNNFRSLGAFTEDLKEAISKGIEKAARKKGADLEKLAQFERDIGALASAFSQSSINGVSVAEPDGNYEEILTSVENTLGQNGSLVRQQLVGYYDMMRGFWQGVGESAFDSPVVFGLVASMVGYAYYMKYGVDASLMQQTMDNAGISVGAANFDFMGDQGGGFSAGTVALPNDIFTATQQTGQIVIDQAVATGEVDDCILSANCHYNYMLPQFMLDAMGDTAGYYLKFRHYVGIDIIASGANSGVNVITSTVEGVHHALDLPVEYNLEFRNTAEAVTQQGGQIFIDANMFQDASHASMLGYGISRVAQNGPGAFRQMGGLSAEFINPLRRIALTLTDPLLKYPLKGSASALNFVGVSNIPAVSIASRYLARKSHSYVESINTRQRLRPDLVNATMDCIDGAAESILLDCHEGYVPEESCDIDAANIKLNIGWYGLERQTVTIKSDNISRLENAINAFALTLQYSAEDIGIESDTYIEFLKSRVENVEQALRRYREGNGECPEATRMLQKTLNGDLQHVMGAEIKFNGQSNIYSSLFPDAQDKIEDLKAKPFYKRFIRKVFAESPVIIDERRQNVLARHTSKKEGRYLRQEYRARVRRKAKLEVNQSAGEFGNGIIPSLKAVFGEAIKRYNQGKYHLAATACYAWDAVVFTAREGIQEPFNQIPMKKRLVAGFSAVSLGSLSAEMGGIDLAIVDTFSSVAGGISAGIATLAVGGALNIPQDLALHTAAVVGSAALVGLPYYLSVEKGVKPVMSAAREKVYRSPPSYDL